MAVADTIRTVLGIIGNITSFGIFLSPLPTFIKIYKWKSTREFSGLPYVMTLLNCFLWVFYGLPIVHPHTIMVTTVNSVGVFLETIYTLMYLYYGSQRRGRLIVACLLAFNIAFFTVEAILTMTLAHTHETRSMIIGISVDIISVFMYAAPLSIMRLVIQTKSVKYMPFLLSLAIFLNGLVWTSYALIHFDIYVVIPNATGAILGGCQLLLYAAYYDRKGGKQNELPTVIDVQMAARENVNSNIHKTDRKLNDGSESLE